MLNAERALLAEFQKEKRTASDRVIGPGLGSVAGYGGRSRSGPIPPVD
jgi:hypothetical protein